MDLPSPSRRPRVCRDIRSAEEITDEELNLVAVSVSDKKYDSIYVSICVKKASVSLYTCDTESWHKHSTVCPIIVTPPILVLI